RLKDKTALITGGGGGIGRVMARAFIEEGARVLICGRECNRLKSAAAEILDPQGCFFYQTADITRADDLKKLAGWIDQAWGSLDVLVNNAGVLGVMVPLRDYPEAIWEEVIRINLTGSFLVTKAMLPLLIKAGGGSIINLSSTVGRKGRANWGAYAVSKFGLEGLTQILADELKPYGIRVNTVNPGGTRTEMRSAAYPEEDPSTLLTPDKIMPLFIYLASDESKKVTGQALNARDWMM
ncbi:MAG: SDR family NAD(P)-dependent oxidoreductase, partial [Nitrospiria bacterium]